MKNEDQVKEFACLFWYIGYGIGSMPSNRPTFEVVWDQFKKEIITDPSLQKRCALILDDPPPK